MKKHPRSAWLILPVLGVLFAALLLLLLCRGCGIVRKGNGDTAKADPPAAATDDKTDQETTGGLRPSIYVEFDSVTLDEEKADPDIPDATETDRTPTAATDASAQTGSTTLPTEQPEPSSSGVHPDALAYEAYMAMSAKEQQKFFDDNFKNDPIAFAQWFQKIKQAYEQENPPIIVTGPINIEDYLNNGD